MSSETQTPQMICDLETNIIEWAQEKEINNPYKQHAKFTEEAGEMAGAMLKGHKENFVEEAGDVLVALAILLNQNGTSFSVAMQAGWDKIKDRKGKTVNGTFIKESDLVNE
jgi:NTP pyrophosphatase (non-canonical NTP hydrolase)